MAQLHTYASQTKVGVYMPRCKEAAAGPREYSGCRVWSPLVDSTAWHKRSALVIRLLHRLGWLSQTCDSQMSGELSRFRWRLQNIYLPVFTLKGTEQYMCVCVSGVLPWVCVIMCDCVRNSLSDIVDPTASDKGDHWPIFYQHCKCSSDFWTSYANHQLPNHQQPLKAKVCWNVFCTLKIPDLTISLSSKLSRIICANLPTKTSVYVANHNHNTV